MGTVVLRHKHVQLDQGKLVTEVDIDRALRAARRKGKLRRVF